MRSVTDAVSFICYNIGLSRELYPKKRNVIDRNIDMARHVVKTVCYKRIGLGTAFERKDIIVENKQFANFRRDTVTLSIVRCRMCIRIKFVLDYAIYPYLYLKWW